MHFLRSSHRAILDKYEHRTQFDTHSKKTKEERSVCKSTSKSRNPNIIIIGVQFKCRNKCSVIFWPWSRFRMISEVSSLRTKDFRIVDHNHGKARVRVMKVDRSNDQHRVFEYSVHTKASVVVDVRYIMFL